MGAGRPARVRARLPHGRRSAGGQEGLDGRLRAPPRARLRPPPARPRRAAGRRRQGAAADVRPRTVGRLTKRHIAPTRRSGVDRRFPRPVFYATVTHRSTGYGIQFARRPSRERESEMPRVIVTTETTDERTTAVVHDERVLASN